MKWRLNKKMRMMDVQEWGERGKESFHSDVLAEGSKLEWMADIQSFISHSLYEERHSVLLNTNSLPSFPPPCPAHTHSPAVSHALHMLTYSIISHSHTGYSTSWGSVSGWTDCAGDVEIMRHRMSCECVCVSAQRKS